MLAAALGLAFWFAAALGFSLTGVLAQFRSATLLGWGLALPPALYVAGYAASAAFRTFVRGLPLRPLTFAEMPRILGGSFLLWKYSLGLLPGTFALTTGISDILVAASALPAGFWLVSRAGRPERGFLLWQSIGLAWLVISSSSGMLTSPPALSTFPLNLIPVFFGPLMIVIHLAAITATIARSRYDG